MPRATIQTFPRIDVTGGIVVEDVPKVGRHQRRPSHPFYLEHRPFEIQPFMCAPVLPGETMKNALLQCRSVTDPIKNKLIGWWDEYYLFYVKLTDLVSVWPDLEAMLLANTALPSGTWTNGSAVPTSYNNGGGADLLYYCMMRCIECYFRDEEEVAAGKVGAYVDVFADNGMKSKVIMSNALQSLTLDTDTPVAEGEELPGQGHDDLPAHLSGFANEYAQWKEMVAMRMTEVTFDDWLKQFGVRAPREEREELHEPELLRYVRSWQYPSNTVNPADGSVASAVSWSHAERADKDRFFAEPGFIVGLTTTRPKVYLGKQSSTITAFMNNAYSFLPALLQADPYTSLRKFDEAAMAGPIDDLAGDYWLDLRDLFMYGEQFVNVTPTASINAVTLPNDSGDAALPLNASYPSDADIDGFFVDAAGGNNLVRKDGRVDLSILSRVTDTTP